MARRPTRTEPARLRLDDQLCFALYTASRAMVRAYGPVLGPLGLTYPQYVTMIALWEAEAPPTVGELGRRLHLDTGTLTPLLKRLEQLGLVHRRRDTVDERRVLVEVTTAGAELETRAACAVPELLDATFGDAAGSAEAARAWAAALKAQLDQLVAAVEPPAPGR